MNRPTRPQLRRELAYLRLRVRAWLANLRSAITGHRRKLILLIGGGLFLLLVGAALSELTSGDGEQSPGAASSAPSVTVPRPATSTAADPPPPAAGAPNPPVHNEKTHLVSAGETLATVAVRRGVPYEQIAAGNRITAPYRIRAGQRLLIPDRPPGVTVVAPGATLKRYAHVLGLTVERLRQLNPHITHPDRIVAGSGLRIR